MDVAAPPRTTLAACAPFPPEPRSKPRDTLRFKKIPILDVTAPPRATLAACVPSPVDPRLKRRDALREKKPILNAAPPPRATLAACAPRSNLAIRGIYHPPPLSPSSQIIPMLLVNPPSRQGPKANPSLVREELAFVTLAGSLTLEATSVYDQVRKFFFSW